MRFNAKLIIRRSVLVLLLPAWAVVHMFHGLLEGWSEVFVPVWRDAADDNFWQWLL